jgi:serine protease inhibitor
VGNLLHLLRFWPFGPNKSVSATSRYLMIRRFVALLIALYLGSALSNAAEFDLAANATNQLGLELQRKLATADENLCISPYSIQSALAMTFAGARGETRAEMARVLHFPAGGDAIHSSFTSLQHSLDEMVQKNAQIAERSKKRGGPSEPITLAVANRLFAQTGYDFRDSFRKLVKKFYGAPFETMDFRKDPAGARERINQWVAGQTRDRIRDLIPEGSLNEMTRLVLANAIYLKAQWASQFYDASTKPGPFHIRGGAAADVPMMRKEDRHVGYAKHDGFTVVALPYSGQDLQFLVLLPDKVNGLRDLESKLSADLLGQSAALEEQDVDLYLPKFKLEPPTIALARTLQALGMKRAFDQPPGSADFDGIAPRKPNDYLYLSQVFHKTFITVDEKGTEAAAATAATMMMATSARMPEPQPIEVKVDRPFVYAIQHVPSGACLFVGRVTDPR